MRLGDHPDDADDRALFPCVIEERLLALLHGAQVIPGREVADACPLRPVTPFRDLLGPRPIVGLGLQEPMCHSTPSSLPRAERWRFLTGRDSLTGGEARGECGQEDTDA